MIRRSHLLALLPICLAGLLASCSSTPTLPSASQPADEAFIAPNPNLFVSGIPPLPARLAAQLAPYTEFRGHGFVDWHPTRREMLISHRPAGGNTAQLFRLDTPLAEPVQLTDSAEPVTTAAYEPRDGRFIVFERGSGGNEATQLYRLDPDSRATTLLTDPAERHDLSGWLRHSGTMIVTSLPLDKTASAGSRSRISTRIRLVDPLDPTTARIVADLDGGGWYVGAVSRDDRLLALTRYLSANESQIWLLDLASGRVEQKLPSPGASEKASHFVGDFSPDGTLLYLTSDRASEFRELFRLELDSGRLQRLSAHIPWDISGASLSEDGRVLVAQANVEGRDELRLFDTISLRELPAPAVPAGNVGSSAFHRRLPALAFSLNNVQGPSQLYSLDQHNGRIEQWTRPYAPPGIDTSRFREQRIIRWKSFDGLIISGLISEPPARFKGKRPVLILIHGGPEAQARFGFLSRYNHLIQDQGIAIVQPNVRGSSGYGKTFLTLDNGRLREDSVKDIGALLDWIAEQPNLDASRVVVSGGSYGGYMSLATAIHYPDRIAGAIDVVGISNFVTFLTNTESYRRDLRRVEYGDERDPEMRAFLEQISPLTNAERIRKPLFVVQGRNDPRVPYTEAEQIVARLRQQNTPVWYLRAENEGHGFARKENADFQFTATVEFLRRLMQ